MNESDAQRYHQLYGVQKKRMTFKKSDFLDYVFMLCICALLLFAVYGVDHLMAQIGLVICAIMVLNFPLRHGFELAKPLIFTRPKEVFYMGFYRLTNIEPVVLLAIAIVLIENVLIYLTPQLPHHVEQVREIAYYLLCGHFALITTYRTVILIAHLIKKDLVREILLQTSWKRTVQKNPGMVLDIFHAYFTGILAHLMMLIPWYLAITYLDFSVVFLPVVCIVNYWVFNRSLSGILRWYYRDHWIAHNSELDFVYLHGAHHDAIPSALLAADESGFLEGLIRQAFGRPIALFNPLMACYYYTTSIWQNVTDHQYIPGVFPIQKNPGKTQHSCHHHGSLEPYGLPFNLDMMSRILPARQKARFDNMSEREKEAYRLDEILTGFEWNNVKYRWYLQLVQRYNRPTITSSNEKATT